MDTANGILIVMGVTAVIVLLLVGLGKFLDHERIKAGDLDPNYDKWAGWNESRGSDSIKSAMGMDGGYKNMDDHGNKDADGGL